MQRGALSAPRIGLPVGFSRCWLLPTTVVIIFRQRRSVSVVCLMPLWQVMFAIKGGNSFCQKVQVRFPSTWEEPHRLDINLRLDNSRRDLAYTMARHPRCADGRGCYGNGGRAGLLGQIGTVCVDPWKLPQAPLPWLQVQPVVNSPDRASPQQKTTGEKKPLSQANAQASGTQITDK